MCLDSWKFERSRPLPQFDYQSRQSLATDERPSTPRLKLEPARWEFRGGLIFRFSRPRKNQLGTQQHFRGGCEKRRKMKCEIVAGFYKVSIFSDSHRSSIRLKDVSTH